jgi:hypothetical protein
MGENEKKVDESWKEQVSKEKDEAGESQEQDASSGKGRTSDSRFPPMQASFGTLVAELAMQASFFLGDIPDPETKEPVQDLNRAKYLIDELGVIEQKTKGNLAPEEERALKNVLFELRMKYVEKSPKS